MSKQSVLAFCNKLNSTLQSQGGTNLYRDLVGDKRVHIFKFSSLEMAKQTKIELESTKNKLVLTQEDRKVINRLSKEMKEDLDKKLSKMATKAEYKYKSTANTISFKFDSSVGSQRVITLGRSKRKIYPSDVFSKVKLAYQPALKKFFKKLQAHLKSTTEVNPETGRLRNRSLRTASGKTAEAAGRYYNAGHAKGAGIFESFLRDSFDGIANSEKLDSKATSSDLQDVLGVDTLITVLRNDKQDSHTISLESDYLNKQGKGGGAEVKAAKKALQKQLKAAIKKLEKSIDTGKGLVKLKGSDSIDAKKRKKIRKNIVDPFKKLKNKNVKVTAKDTKINSKTASNKLNKASSGGKGLSATKLGAGVRAARMSRQRQKASESPASSPLKMLTMLNSQLPTVVEQNMEDPALNRRTGRFARSVKAVDITTTNKGFTSVGYTYQKNPYQTFEPGYAQGSVERDPRRLIDKSIREIAASAAIGRLYTRRL